MHGFIDSWKNNESMNPIHSWIQTGINMNCSGESRSKPFRPVVAGSYHELEYD